MTKDVKAPLLQFDGVVVGKNRPLDVSISATDRIL
jgi:hypothetical protein